jgi:hypothetical protein
MTSVLEYTGIVSTIRLTRLGPTGVWMKGVARILAHRKFASVHKRQDVVEVKAAHGINNRGFWWCISHLVHVPGLFFGQMSD